DKIDMPNKILIFGRLDPVKGHERFFQIFREFRKLNPESTCRLLVFGREENISFEDLEELAAKNEISDYVSFKSGTIENLSNELASVDIGVVSSLGSEIICRVAHEFLMCGTKVLVSGAGATNEVLKDKIFGASYKNCSDQKAAEQLDVLLSETETVETKLARSKKAREYFSLQSMSSELELFLEDLSIFGA
ncbi:glycosyltransferase, partial [bacterium]|nr:glycosyltransferase [bacterium]